MVYISSIVNEAIKTVFYLFISFLRKLLQNKKKRKASKKQLTKQKHVNIKQQKQQFVSCTKNSLRFFMLQNFS